MNFNTFFTHNPRTLRVLHGDTSSFEENIRSSLTHLVFDVLFFFYFLLLQSLFEQNQLVRIDQLGLNERTTIDDDKNLKKHSPTYRTVNRAGIFIFISVSQ